MDNNGLILLANTALAHHIVEPLLNLQQVQPQPPIQEDNLKKIYECDLCHYKYTTMRGIRDHLQKKHNLWFGQDIAPPSNDCLFAIFLTKVQLQ